MIGFYVWSKTLGTASLQTTGNIGNSAGTVPEDYYNLALEKQRADNDRTHVSTDLRRLEDGLLYQLQSRGSHWIEWLDGLGHRDFPEWTATRDYHWNG